MSVARSAGRTVSLLYLLAVVLAPCSSPAQEQAKLTASDAAAGDVFGGTVSVSGDTAVVGAYETDDNGDSSGSAACNDLKRSFRARAWSQDARPASRAVQDWTPCRVSYAPRRSVVQTVASEQTPRGPSSRDCRRARRGDDRGARSTRVRERRVVAHSRRAGTSPLPGLSYSAGGRASIPGLRQAKLGRGG